MAADTTSYENGFLESQTCGWFLARADSDCQTADKKSFTLLGFCSTNDDDGHKELQAKQVELQDKEESLFVTYVLQWIDRSSFLSHSRIQSSTDRYSATRRRRRRRFTE